MCGITGIFDCQSFRNIDVSLLKKMNQSLVHRGPDAGGEYIAQGLGLAHRRLSIIDIQTGQQPMLNLDKSLAVVFNGEIYNYKALRRLLESHGYGFQTNSDTEVLLHGYAHWGHELPNYLRGMFAFAIWDQSNRKLFLARDRLGIKPLYYAYLTSGEFIFGSELKAILAHPNFNQSLNPYAICDYFAYGYIPDPKTIYKMAHKLNPGHTLTVCWGQSQGLQKAYWDVPDYDESARSESETREQLQDKIKESVDLRMLSEVPLGAFLSGGVDSSVVVNEMTKFQNTPVTTCSIGFQEKIYDESTYAQQVAEHLQTDHFLKMVEGRDVPPLDLLSSIYDEPFADSSCIPTLQVCQSAREHVTVALSGDGGDEVFAGYRRYQAHLLEEKVRNRLPLSIRQGIFKPLASLYPRLKRGPRYLRAKSTFESLCFNAVEGYFNNISIFKPHMHQQLFSSALKKELGGYGAISVLNDHASHAQTNCPLNLIQYLDIKAYLPGDILTKVDRASMHHSLEVRVPLLDHELVSLAQTIPSHMKLKNQTTKYILKKTYEQALPLDILYRKKQGFAVPLGDWFRGPLKQKALNLASSPALIGCGFLDMSTVNQVVTAHLNQGADNSAMLWTLCMFEAFMNKHLSLQPIEDESYAHTACA